MSSEHPLLDLEFTTVQRTGNDLVEVRFKAEHTLTIAGISGLLAERERLSEGRPMRTLIVFPPTDMDFDLNMITTDNYTAHRTPLEQFTRAVAWVTRTPHNDRFARLYFTYFPSPVPSMIFDEEAEARAWLEGFKDAGNSA